MKSIRISIHSTSSYIGFTFLGLRDREQIQLPGNLPQKNPKIDSKKQRYKMSKKNIIQEGKCPFPPGSFGFRCFGAVVSWVAQTGQAIAWFVHQKSTKKSSSKLCVFQPAALGLAINHLNSNVNSNLKFNLKFYLNFHLHVHFHFHFHLHLHLHLRPRPHPPKERTLEWHEIW